MIVGGVAFFSLHHTIAGRGVIWGILLGMVTFHVARSQVSPALGLGLLCGAQVATTRLCYLRIITKILRNELLYNIFMFACNDSMVSAKYR